MSDQENTTPESPKEDPKNEEVKKASLDSLRDESTTGIALKTDAVEDSENLKVILDIPVTVSMEVGKTELSIRNLLKLNQGSVVELDRLAGDPLDVYVNGTLIAHGEVVIVNEKFAIRLTDVISTAERIKKIG